LLSFKSDHLVGLALEAMKIKNAFCVQVLYAVSYDSQILFTVF